MSIRYLTPEDLPALLIVVKNHLNSKPEGYYAWRDSPQVDREVYTRSEVEEIADTFTKKLDAVYSERFLLSMNYAVAAIQRGHKVAFLQKTAEIDPVFDATGWIILSINSYPLFHISPQDLSLSILNELGWVNVIREGSAEAEEHAWKGTDKSQEYLLMMRWLISAPVSSDI
jgi:hypothetical protein